MSSNEGWDANGMEREPFPARDEFARPSRPPRVVGCKDCAAGKGTTQPGPPHCRVHDRHCSAESCW